MSLQRTQSVFLSFRLFIVHLTPLHLAARNGRHETVKYLVQLPGVDINARDRLNETPLHYAAYGGCCKCVEALISEPNCYARAENNDKETPLDVAVRSKRKEAVELIRSHVNKSSEITIK